MSHYDDNATISHKNETVTACKQALREKSRASGKRNERELGAGKESESSSFPPPFAASPLTRAFACHSKWRSCSQSITFLCNRTRSVFGEPADVGNSEEILVHVSFFTHRLLFWFTKEVWLSLIFCYTVQARSYGHRRDHGKFGRKVPV